MKKLSATFLYLLTPLLLLLPTSAIAVDSVFVQSRLDYNAILISGVDVLFVYDDAALEYMPQTKSSWFSGKRQFLEQAGDAIDLVSVFVPQGFDSEMISMPERKDEAVKVFVVAQHDASSRAPIDITDYAHVLVEINEFGIIVSRRD
ncbi:MAG: hypothetical protein RKH07_08135 [Gammaproteobacteria bacterium]